MNQKYVAFLRGVNVKGTAMKMADVCNIFKVAGCENVISILSTGNIIFDSDKKMEMLKNDLEQSLSNYYNYDAYLFLKNTEEMFAIMNDNPFVKEAEFHTYTFITTVNFEQKLMQEFLKVTHSEGEEVRFTNHNFYWKVAKGFTLESAFGKILGKKDFKNSITSRNINTIEKICAKL